MSPTLPTYTCYNCGFQSQNAMLFITVNQEAPDYSMDNPYGGYPGDNVCEDCAVALWHQKEGR